MKVREMKVRETEGEEMKVRETEGEEMKVRETRVRETRVRETKVRETRVRETKVRETEGVRHRLTGAWQDRIATGAEPDRGPATWDNTGHCR